MHARHARRQAGERRHCRGVVTLEYVFMLILGLLPLLLFTFTAVMIFAARQSLTLAAEEGARAAMRYPVAVAPGVDPLQIRLQNACNTAATNMAWLHNFSSDSGAASCNAEALVDSDCGLADTTCVRVTTRYDYDAKPFLPGTRTLYRWVLEQPISSTAVAQLDLDR